MKFYAAFCLFICSSIIGVACSKKFLNRYKFYLSILNFNQDFKNSLSFKREHISNLLKKDYKFEHFNNVLEQKLKNINCKALSLPNFLNENDKNQINEYFSQIGKYDPITQAKILEGYDEVFKQNLTLAFDDNKKYGILFQKIGIIVGLVAFIIVV